MVNFFHLLSFLYKIIINPRKTKIKKQNTKERKHSHGLLSGAAMKNIYPVTLMSILNKDLTQNYGLSGRM